MVKILFLIHDLGHGGAEKVLVNLVNNINKNEFDVTVLALFDGGVNRQFLKDEVKYQYCYKKVFPGNSHIMKLFPPRLLYKCFVKEHFDIVVSYLEGPTARIVSGADAGVEKICWIHCTLDSRRKISKAFRSFREAATCYQSMNKIVFVSEGVRRSFKELIPGILDGGVLYNTNETDMIREKALEQLDGNIAQIFSEDELKICFIGKLVESKGIYRLAKIHVRLIQAGYKIHTYVIGRGEEKEKICNYIEENGCTSSFSILGYQINPYKYLSKCDWFVCASFEEGFSTAATEALILGVPVITTNVCGMEEMLGKNNEFGIIVDNDENALFEGIEQILVNPDITKEYKKRAENRGKFFSKERTVQAVEEFLKKK